MSVLADCLKSIHNAEKRGKRQVRPRGVARGLLGNCAHRRPTLIAAPPPAALLQVLIRPSSKVIIKFLEVMQKHGYVGEFEIVDDHRSGKIVVNLTGRLNKCGIISPRFDVKVGDMERWINNLLPSRQFGHIVLTTSSGIIDHEDARRKHTGGKVLGFFY